MRALLSPFTYFCAAVVMTYAVANYNGYVVASYLLGAQSADKSVNRYHK